MFTCSGQLFDWSKKSLSGHSKIKEWEVSERKYPTKALESDHKSASWLKWNQQL